MMLAIQDQDTFAQKALAALWDTPITYVVQYAEATDSVMNGYFLSYFTEKCMPGEWIPLQEEQLKRDIGLTAKQWRMIRNDLSNLQILKSKRMGAAPSLYTLDDELLEAKMRAGSSLSAVAMTTKPISINRLHVRTLGELKVSIKSIILLGIIQSLTVQNDLAARADWSDWIVLPEAMVNGLSYLTRYEQNTALTELKSFGIVDTRVSGMPATREARYSLKALAELSYALLQGE